MLLLQHELFSFGQSLIEKFPYLVDLRIYNNGNSSISWLALPTEITILDSFGMPLAIDWAELDPPLTAEEELEQLLNVWHRKSPRLKTVQIVAGIVWKFKDNSDGQGCWVEEHI
jgi:hypothetical protein